MLFDLHVHSKYSVDALTKPETIIKICKKRGIGVSITDHNNTDAYSSPNGLLVREAKESGVFLIPGEEIKVFSPEGKTEGEVIAYFPQEQIEPAPFFEILDAIREQGALLSCPHPFDWPRKNFRAFTKEWKRFDCMETYNARAYYQGLNKKAQAFSLEQGIPGLGVSDAHTPEEIGNGLTEIDAADEEEFRKQIKKGKTKVVPRAKAGIRHHFQTQLAKRNLIKER